MQEKYHIFADLLHVQQPHLEQHLFGQQVMEIVVDIDVTTSPGFCKKRSHGQGCATCCSLAAGLRENGERMRKWRENEEIERRWRENEEMDRE